MMQTEMLGQMRHPDSTRLGPRDPFLVTNEGVYAIQSQLDPIRRTQTFSINFDFFPETKTKKEHANLKLEELPFYEDRPQDSQFQRGSIFESRLGAVFVSINIRNSAGFWDLRNSVNSITYLKLSHDKNTFSFGILTKESVSPKSLGFQKEPEINQF